MVTNKDTKALIKWHLLVISFCYAKIANIKTSSQLFSFIKYKHFIIIKKYMLLKY